MKNLQESKKKESAVGSIVFCIILVALVVVFIIFEDNILYSRSYTPERDATFTVIQIVKFHGSTIYRYDVERKTDGVEFKALASSNSIFKLGDTVGLVKFRYNGRTSYSVTSVEVTNM